MSENPNKPEEPNYAKVIKLHFGTGLNLVQVVIEGLVDLLIGVVSYTMLTFSKNMVEIAGHSIIFIAPIPNSMTVYRTLNKAGYGTAGGWSGAIAVELVLFFVIEGALFILSKYIKDQKNYKVAFYSMAGAVVVGTISVVGLVAYLEIAEGGMPVLAIMPVFSFLAFVTVAVKRWNEGQEASVQAEKEQKRQERLSKRYGVNPLGKPLEKTLGVTATEPEENPTLTRRKRVATHYKSNPQASYQVVATALGIPNKGTVFQDVKWLLGAGVLEKTVADGVTTFKVNGKYDAFMEGKLDG